MTKDTTSDRKKPTSFMIRKSLLDKLKKEAKECRRPITTQLEIVLEEHFAKANA